MAESLQCISGIAVTYKGSTCTKVENLSVMFLFKDVPVKYLAGEEIHRDLIEPVWDPDEGWISPHPFREPRADEYEMREIDGVKVPFIIVNAAETSERVRADDPPESDKVPGWVSLLRDLFS